MKIRGIYIIQSKIYPDRCYVGSAVDINKRWRNHLSLLQRNKHHSPMLQYHFNKYGIEDLQFSVERQIENKEDLIWIEQFYIDVYQPYFNVCKTAGSSLGRHHSKEIKEKCRQQRLGKTHTEETKQKLSKSHIGKHHTEESKEKNRQAALGNKNWVGKHHSEETKEKMRIAWIRRKENKVA